MKTISLLHYRYRNRLTSEIIRVATSIGGILNTLIKVFYPKRNLTHCKVEIPHKLIIIL